MNDHHFDKKSFWFVIRFFVLPLVILFGVFQLWGGRGESGSVFPSRSALEDIIARVVSDDKVFDEERFLRQIEALTLQKQIPENGRLVAVDLSSMELHLYENGTALETISVVSKGRPGSFWETPSGLYKIKTKEENHYSSIGEVDMPYSMQFYGNFFIHGWPTYDDGQEVGIGFSGGCVRLRTEDAKRVYEFVDIGTPVFIFEPAPNRDNLPTIELTNLAPPSVSASAYLVADLDTGDVFLEKEAETVRSIASLTKLMTAVVANETVSFDRQIAVRENQAYQSEGDRDRFRTGESFVIGNMLYPLLMESNNNIADSIATYYGRHNFTARMNEKASAIGMTKTVFADASGISPDNVSTAEDLFTLARYLDDRTSFILKITRTDDKKIVSDEGNSYTLKNFNHFADDDAFIGGKTGYTTAAKETMISIFTMDGEPERRVAIIVLGSDNREKDTVALRQWFEKARIRPKGEKEIRLGFVGDIMLDRGVETSVIKNGKGSFAFVFKDIADDLTSFDFLFGNLEGPISDKGKNQGSIYSFRMDPSVAKAIQDAGFDAVSLANNHMSDWGVSALTDTMHRLSAEGITYVGAGATEEDAYSVKYVDVEGVTVGLIAMSEFNTFFKAGATPGIAVIELPALDKAVREARAKADIVVASFHFGTEYASEPNDYQRRIAKSAIDAGADLVVGHHPHVIQPVEKYKDGYIAYSLGNFVFDQYFSKETMEGALLEVAVKNKKITDVSTKKVILNSFYQPKVE